MGNRKFRFRVKGPDGKELVSDTFEGPQDEAAVVALESQDDSHQVVALGEDESSEKDTTEVRALD